MLIPCPSPRACDEWGDGRAIARASGEGQLARILVDGRSAELDPAHAQAKHPGWDGGGNAISPCGRSRSRACEHAGAAKPAAGARDPDAGNRGSGAWHRLHELYAEDTVVERPFALPAPRRAEGREAIRKHFTDFAAAPLKL
jgi:hypothetical protein